VVIVRRLRHLDSKPAAIHTSFMDSKIYAPILKVDLGRESLLAAIERVCGTRVAYSKDSVRATLVSSEDMGLLEIPAGSPVLDVEGVAFSENGQPTRYTKAIYRSDVFRLAVTNMGQQAALLKVDDLRKLPPRNDGERS
jgi:GntR family transcriptional regulator